MADDRVQDLLGLDREVAQADVALRRWRSALAVDPEGHASDDPLHDIRRVAGKSMWDALGELPPGGADAPLRDALRRWVLWLVLARIGLVDDVAWARAAAAPLGEVADERPRLVSWREAWRGVVLASTPARARLWLRAAADAAPHLAEAARARAARRVEVARRMGLSHPWEAVAPAAPSELRAAAARLLDATEDLSRAVWKEALGRELDAAAVLHGAVSREAGEGWPTRISARWLEEIFGVGTHGLPIDLPALPQAAGAASFARALEAFGFALRVAVIPTSMPFSLAREPASVQAHSVGFLFGALAADREFYTRALGIGRRAASAQARVLARAALLEARLNAARLLLGDEGAFAPLDVFDEMGPRLFGSPLDERLRGAWPAARDDEPARLIALLETRALQESMRERFDTDWFRNPRAWTYLRAQEVPPARQRIERGLLETSADDLARAFEKALG
jgi:hypothetical protein